jgi:hypothetical protein
MPDPSQTAPGHVARAPRRVPPARSIRLGPLETPAQRATAARRIAHAMAAGRLSARAGEALLRAIRLADVMERAAARVTVEDEPKHTGPLINLTLIAPPKPPA